MQTVPSDTNHGDHESHPTFWIVSQTVADDFISGQTADRRDQRCNDVPIGRADISLTKEKKTVKPPLGVYVYVHVGML
ncbi:hypothetical protein EYF80_061986 [Liparis tanakae]|uniref:Uncharacterized protein n=1 Tax=Liparis tanakae TaxID=230148 RepID=A0A4Z2EFZ4_9TELE|nr:hypothetical protein EYF80_061986 [Liparis tanakae]